MNRYAQEKWSWIEGTHGMRLQLLDALNDENLLFNPGGANMTLGNATYSLTCPPLLTLQLRRRCAEQNPARGRTLFAVLSLAALSGSRLACSSPGHTLPQSLLSLP